VGPTCGMFWRREDSIACFRSLVPCLHTLNNNEGIRFCVPSNNVCLLLGTHKLCLLRNSMCLLLTTHQLRVLCISMLLLRTHQLCVLCIGLLLLRTYQLCSTQHYVPVPEDKPFVFHTTVCSCC
jgi:hypothetical protein